jgi:hypothetical protein
MLSYSFRTCWHNAICTSHLTSARPPSSPVSSPRNSPLPNPPETGLHQAIPSRHILPSISFSLIQKVRSYARHVTLILPIVKWSITPDCNVQKCFRRPSFDSRWGENCLASLLCFCFVGLEFLVGLEAGCGELSVVRSFFWRRGQRFV